MAVQQNIKTKGINIWLAFMRFIRRLFSKQNLQKIISQICNPDHSDERKAYSAALGVFIGIVPIWGFQGIAAIFLSVVLKLNKALVVVFSQVSFPLFIPFVMYMSYQVGGLWIRDHASLPSLDPKKPFQNISQHLGQYIYGSITLAVIAAVAAGLLTYGWLKLVKSFKQYQMTSKLEKAL